MTPDPAASLPPLDVAARTRRLRGLLADTGVDALLVTRLVNVRYLTGFTGSAATVLVSAAGLTFVTDGRYRDQAADQLGAHGVDATIEVGTTPGAQREALQRTVAGAAIRRLGLEAHGVTWAQQRAFAGEWFPDVELVATEHLVERLRLVKDDAEVARIRAACAIADDALGAVLPRLTERPTEREVALALELAMRERGASGVSFDPIIAGGPNGARPHARPTDRVVEHHELVVLDFGCVVDGYCSDTTRTVSVGDPGPEARRLWDTVARAQAAGQDAVAPGVACAEVDRTCRSVIADAGLGDAFLHGTGHGVGLEIHEDPRVATTSTATLAAGHVVTVEPGVYLPGVGGVRIEDTVVVTPDGPLALTGFPKELVLQ